MSNQAPFYPVTQVPPQQLQQPQQQQWQPHPAAAPYATPYPTAEQVMPDPQELWCDSCEGRIEWGEQVIELFLGVAGRNSQTGLPAAVVPEGGQPQIATMHKECALEFVMQEVSPDQADDIIYQYANELYEEFMNNEELDRKLEDERQ